MKLEQLAEISVGVNVTRIKQTAYESRLLYSNDDLLNDLSMGIRTKEIEQISADTRNTEKFIISEGDILYSFVSSKVAIASKESEGKVLNQNFAKLDLKFIEINPRYLCYSLNESKCVEKQMGVLMQGSVAPKMTPAILRQVEIEILPKKQQQRIGDYYFYVLRKKSLVLQELELQQKVYYEILERMNK